MDTVEKKMFKTEDQIKTSDRYISLVALFICFFIGFKAWIKFDHPVGNLNICLVLVYIPPWSRILLKN